MNFSDGVSVCIPVYNAAKYLPDCVASALNQTFVPTEIVLLDDASTDRSLSVALKLAKTDARIKVFTKKHSALGDTRNQLIRYSSSGLMAFLDADDIAEPDRLAKQVAFMSRHPNCVGLGGHVCLIDEFGHRFFRQVWQPQEPDDVERQLLMGRASTIMQTTLMLRRTVFEQVGGYNPALNCSEDLELYLRLAEVGELWNLPDVLVKMRRHPQSISSIDRNREAEARRANILMPAWKRRGISELPLYDIGTEAASRSEWYVRTSLGYLNAGSPRRALIHWLCGFKENPASIDVWRAGIIIICRILSGRTGPKSEDK